MKKLFVLLLSLMIFISCGSDEKKNESGNDNTESQSSIEAPGEFEAASGIDRNEAFALNYEIPQGQKMTYKLTSVATTNQKIIADSTITNEVSQTLNYIFNLESLGQADNNTRVKISIESVEISANYNGEVVSFDSKAINDEQTNLKFAEYSSLPNQSFDVVINNQGRIVEVNNITGIVDRYLEIQQAPAIKPEEREQINSQLKEQALKPLVQQLFRYLPEKETNIDSTWDLVYESPMGLYNLTNTATSTLRDVVQKDDNLVAKITTDLNVTYEGDGYIKQGEAAYQFEEPKIDGNAITYFNIEKNIVIKSELTTTTEMNVVVTAKNPSGVTETARRSDLSVNRNFIELLKVN
ncbi:MAG: DUF6263 family protein [Melioribacteraceae bacterium]|nr:MAG: DUF6263 family protein [Melioribacteraceae bacterium]